MVGYLDNQLNEFDVPADALELKVTESSMMGEPEKTKNVLQAVNRRGIAATISC